MKKIYFIFLCLVFSYNTNSQVIFSETFDSIIPSSWTIIDADQLPTTLLHKRFASWGWGWNGTARSTSQYQSGNTSPTDDWLITPSITIPNTGRYKLKWKGQSVFSPTSSPGESYEVKLSTTGVTQNDFSVTLDSIESEIQDDFGGKNREILLPETTAGQTIHIAFRHTSVQQSHLTIDSVFVEKYSKNDIQMVSESMVTYMNPGNINVTGTVKNLGYDTITSFQLSYSTGGQYITETINASILPNQTYDFQHGTPLQTTVNEGPYQISICATLDNDVDSTNNCIDTYVNIISSQVNKKVVIEERTGTWCQYCPIGTSKLEKLVSSDTNAIGIAVHNNDPMEVKVYDTNLVKLPGATSLPYATADRKKYGHAANLNIYFTNRKNTLTTAAVDLNLIINEDSTQLTAKGTLKAVANMKGDYRVAIVIAENEVKGTGPSWQQVNQYSGGSTSVPYEKDGQTFDWKDLPNPVNVSELFGGYDHVARHIVQNKFYGIENSLPTTLKNDSSYSYSYSIPIDSNWNVKNIYGVVMFIDKNENEILNSNKSKVKKATVASITEINQQNFNSRVFPNPMQNGMSTLIISSNKTSNISYEVFNLNGKRILNNKINNVNGVMKFPINLTEFSKGMYFIKINSNKYESETIKIIR